MHCFLMVSVSYWSSDFRPTYGWLHKTRALVPRGVPFLAAIATATPTVISLVNMSGCEFVFITRPVKYVLCGTKANQH